MQFLINESQSVFRAEPSLLKLKPPVNVCGDIHGQFTDLLRLLEMNEPLPSSRYLFLGDYVDRGAQSLEVICLLLALKLKYPDSVYMLRGNHECREMTELYGFMREVRSKHNQAMYDSFCDLFDWLPIAAVISKRIFCVHGGISPSLNDLEQIEEIQRPLDIPEEGLLADLLWSDPDPKSRNWGESDRGFTYVWGLTPAKTFLDRHKLSVLIRAHQLAMHGIDFPFRPERSVITVFSAPAYTGEFKNEGAFLRIDSKLVITTVIIPIMRIPAVPVSVRPQMLRSGSPKGSVTKTLPAKTVERTRTKTPSPRRKVRR